jgi:hypothetical protein
MGKGVDDAAEQHRFGEWRARKRDVGESKHPAEPPIRAGEAPEHKGEGRT